MALRSFIVFFTLKVTLSPAELLKVSSTRRVSTGGGEGAASLGTASGMVSGMVSCMVSCMLFGMPSGGGGVLMAPLRLLASWVFEFGELFPSAMLVRACVSWWYRADSI